MAIQRKKSGRERRKQSIRKDIAGTAARPRLTVFRSNKHIYAQVIDDERDLALASVSTLSPSIAEAVKAAESKVERAAAVGRALGEACKAKGIEQVVFDRNGYIYHGRVQAVADAAREAGLDF